MRIGIISDTHDHHRCVLDAIDKLNDKSVDIVLHAGDIVSPFTARAFADLDCRKIIAVFGNNDGEKLALKKAFDSIGGEIHEYCYKGELGGKKIYMTHVPIDIEQIVACQEFDIVIYGHTHRQDIRKVGKSLVINPGEGTDWVTGTSNLVILDTDTMAYEVLNVSAR